MLTYFKQYAAFGSTNIDTLGVTRQGYIGKEKDVENGLGDHGVRKYDYNRFNSIDPLWEKYYGWSPYQYCMNNPIWAKDWDGKIIMIKKVSILTDLLSCLELWGAAFGEHSWQEEVRRAVLRRFLHVR